MSDVGRGRVQVRMKERSDVERQMNGTLLAHQEHTHPVWVERPWWKCRPYWDSENSRLDWIVRDRVEIPCDGHLTIINGPRAQYERTDLGTKMVASAEYRCSDPSVPGQERVLLYVATLLEEGGLYAT